MQIPILAIVGPTASGKSHVAMECAEAFGAEILSCDSVQVYREFSIGCAKPTLAEQSRVRHHLIDVADWHEDFDAQRYRQLAGEALREIAQHGKQGILCGGTGLYLRALRYGLVSSAPADPQVRAILDREEQLRPGSLYTRLQRIDPESAAGIDPRNLVRVVRALEIHILTGEPASGVRKRHGFSSEEIPMRIVALRWPPKRMKQRIKRRVEQMLTAGLLEEVEALLSAGVTPQARAMRSVGYRQAWEVIAGQQPRDALLERIVKATWAYARRQMTWFRRERGVTWVDVTSGEDAAEQVSQIFCCLAQEHAAKSGR
ncbi:MAG: tRNA (adenosine(37)-N6)-dimethylallyltransferase MiaA [Myxococcota bacterium]